jgi:hypothetical protein
VLELEDLWSFWWSDTELELKISLTLRYLADPSDLVRHRELIRSNIFTAGRRAMKEQVVARLVTVHEDAEPMDADLARRGGIRRDPKTIERVRALQRQRGRRMLESQMPLRDWDGTALATLSDVVGEHGGHLVLFEMPQSSILTAPMETALRREDRALFEDWARRRGIVILKPDFTTTDEDFPDLLHLAAPKAKAFTKVLADALLAHRSTD